MKELVEKIAEQIKGKIKKTPEIAVVLGSGLSGVADCLKNKVVIDYKDLDGMPCSHIEGHKNQFVVGEIGNKTVIAMLGRFHAYDGFSAKQVSLPIYIFKKLGVKSVILTNSAGGVNPTFNAGDIMIINSHINFAGSNPLVGGPILDFGEKFIDLKSAYTPEYIVLAKQIAKEQNMDIKTGVYAQFLGPTYETPAEVKMLQILGVDSVAMSTIYEVIASCQCKMKVLAFSCIANKAVSADSKESLSHEEVLENARITAQKLQKLIISFIQKVEI